MTTCGIQIGTKLGEAPSEPADWAEVRERLQDPVWAKDPTQSKHQLRYGINAESNYEMEGWRYNSPDFKSGFDHWWSGMKVQLVAFDSCPGKSGPFPNLALMKIANFYSHFGEVGLIGPGLKKPRMIADPDLVCISVIREENAPAAAGSATMYSCPVEVGGTGISLRNDLPSRIEDCEPLYDIYDDQGVPGWPYAIGFSSRGCGRRCSFCVVPRKEGSIQADTDLRQLVGDWNEGSQRFDKLLLLDNNLMMDPGVEVKLEYLIDWRGKVNYSQGIDARVIAKRPDLAELLAQTKYYGRNFKSRSISLAYDHPSQAKIVDQAVANLERAGFDLHHHVQFFVLVNYSTTHEEDMARIDHLKSLGTNPFVMVFDKDHAPLRTKRLARWANNRYFLWACTFPDFLDSHKSKCCPTCGEKIPCGCHQEVDV